MFFIALGSTFVAFPCPITAVRMKPVFSFCMRFESASNTRWWWPEAHDRRWSREMGWKMGLFCGCLGKRVTHGSPLNHRLFHDGWVLGPKTKNFTPFVNKCSTLDNWTNRWLTAGFLGCLPQQLSPPTYSRTACNFAWRSVKKTWGKDQKAMLIFVGIADFLQWLVFWWSLRATCPEVS